MIKGIAKQQIVSAIAAVLIFNLIPQAGAQIYKYVDENGRTIYSDKPIGDELHVQPNTGRPGRSGSRRTPSHAGAPDRG